MQEEFLKFMQLKTDFQIGSCRLRLARSVALPHYLRNPPADRVGGRRLWHTSSWWCFDKGYPGRHVAKQVLARIAHQVLIVTVHVAATAFF